MVGLKDMSFVELDVVVEPGDADEIFALFVALCICVFAFVVVDEVVFRFNGNTGTGLIPEYKS